MGVLCRIGLHKWRTISSKGLPPLPPKFPQPRYVTYQCMKCGKKDWNFKP